VALYLIRHLEPSGARAPSVAEELIELDFGAWEGIRWNALPREELDDWARDVWHYRPGGGESAAMVEERWRRWYDRVSSLDLASIVAVTHAGVIRTALASMGVLARPEAARASIAFGSVYAIGPPARSLPARGTQPQGVRPCATL
jgi:alpha-ribazole phosphatase